MGDFRLEYGHHFDKNTNTEASYETTRVQHADCFSSSLQDASDEEEDSSERERSTTTKGIAVACTKCTKETACGLE